MVPEDARMLAFTSLSGQNNKDRNYHKREKNQQKTEDFRDGRGRYILTNPRIVNYQMGTQTQTFH